MEVLSFVLYFAELIYNTKVILYVVFLKNCKVMYVINVKFL